MRQRREEIAHRYTEAFAHDPAIEVPTVRSHVQHAWHLYMIRLNCEHLTTNRDQVIVDLKNRQIGSSVHFIPLHVHPYYEATYGYKPEDFPVAYGEYQREISLPIYSKMSDQDVQDVIDGVIDVVRKFRAKSIYAFAGH
jgi:dTDP-4-amino-4,6-dideoxygalactose transaminase